MAIGVLRRRSSRQKLLIAPNWLHVAEVRIPE
jgi:hypothetical protein